MDVVILQRQFPHRRKKNTPPQEPQEVLKMRVDLGHVGGGHIVATVTLFELLEVLRGDIGDGSPRQGHLDRMLTLLLSHQFQIAVFGFTISLEVVFALPVGGCRYGAPGGSLGSSSAARSESSAR